MCRIIFEPAEFSLINVLHRICDDMKKVVFKDNDQTKTIRGLVEFEEGFVKVTDVNGKEIYINKKHIIFMREE